VSLGNILPDNATVLDEEVDSELQISAELPEAYGKSPLFNFDPSSTPGFEQRGAQGKLTITEDQRSLLTWIQKAVRTPRGRYMIYDEDYGTDMAANLGSIGSTSLIENGAEDLRRCLLIHPLIQDVTDVGIYKTNQTDTCLIRFTVVDRLAGPFQVQIGL
jgi:hypothetical protein